MASQSELDEFVSETPSNTVTTARTVKLPLATSARKNEALRRAIDEWQTVARRMADFMPTFHPARWQQRDTQMTRLARREFDSLDIYAHDRNVAVNKVREAFASWDSNGRDGAHPRGQFGDGDYMRVCSCCDRLTVRENDRGFGVRLKLLKRHDPLWFHIDGGAYQEEYLDSVVNGDADTGGGEVHLHDDGSASLHLSITRDIDVYEPAAVPRYVGVDVGERVLYATAVVDPSDDGEDSVEAVKLESGREFRHHRERLKQRRTELQQADDLRGVRAVRGEHERYTEHVLDTASREIVDLARDHVPCALVLEDMTNYRETAEDPIHDFPYALLQEKIAYKATGEGLPVVSVDPAGTSVTCRRCGQKDPTYRDGVEFTCRRCDYEIHADVNAAINIATRGHEQIE